MIKSIFRGLFPSYNNLEVNNRVFPLVRNLGTVGIERDFSKSLIISGWVTQGELKSVFNDFEKSVDNFNYLRNVDLFFNFLKYSTFLSCFIGCLLYLNNKHDIASLIFSFYFPIFFVVLALKKLYEKRNYGMFVYDVDLNIRYYNKKFFYDKNLEFIFDFKREEFHILNYEEEEENDEKESLLRVVEKRKENLNMSKTRREELNRIADLKREYKKVVVYYSSEIRLKYSTISKEKKVEKID